jgi:hypothetical protein
MFDAILRDENRRGRTRCGRYPGSRGLRLMSFDGKDYRFDAGDCRWVVGVGHWPRLALFSLRDAYPLDWRVSAAHHDVCSNAGICGCDGQSDGTSADERDGVFSVVPSHGSLPFDRVG